MTPRILVTMMVWLKPDGGPALARFREQATALWKKYDLRVERVLAATGKGQLIGENRLDVPDLLQVISLPSLGAFQKYVMDPEYLRLAAARDAGLARMSAVVGSALDVSALAPSSDSALADRQYAVAFVSFQPDGARGLDEFNRRASGLFARHGMHVESMMSVAKTITSLGRPLENFAPERVVVFFLDDATALKAYAADPEYKALAPLRDEGLRSYDFFLARSPR
ncbi:MAG TPA: hypothetical protein VI299_25550 [Polyangiales bacterium]